MDFDISPIWTKQHTFLKPVLFAPGQAFHGANLKFNNQKKGALAVFDGQGWNALNIGVSSLALVVINGVPSWGNVDASIVKGTLKVESGGTGISQYVPGALAYARSINELAQLSPGNNGQILTVCNNLPEWASFPGVNGSGQSSYLAVWSSSSNMCATNIQIDDNKLILKEKHPEIHLGKSVIANGDSRFSVHLDDDSFILTKDTFAIQQNNKTVVKFWQGRLANGIIPVERLEGVLAAKNGGTGLQDYGAGDILYAVDKQNLVALSIDNSDGFYLKSVNGRPQWASIDSDASAKTTSSSTMSLSAGTQHRAPLQFQLGELTNSPSPGAVEWDGSRLLITTKDNKRKAVVFQGENINAYAKGVTDIVPTSLGGLGKNLSNVTLGSLLFVDSNTSVGILKPEPGQFVRIHPGTNLPMWSHAVVELVSGEGIVVDKTAKYTPSITIDQSENFSPLWQSVHTFEKGVTLGDGTTLYIPSNQGSGLPQIHFVQSEEPAQKQNGDVWFDSDLFVYVNGATVNVTATRVRTQSLAQIQHLRICEGETPSPNTTRKIKYPLPYGADGITRVKWKFVRADLRIEDCPSEADAKLKIYVNGDSVLESPLIVAMGSQQSSTQNFIMPYAYSGDLIAIEFGETGGGDCWSLFFDCN